MNEWMPIETAPKDGQEIIAYGIRRGDWGYTDDSETWTGVRWQEGWHEGKRVGVWIEQRPAPRYSTGFTPTHWMPLPSPPTDRRTPEAE